jgi:threonine/homoserine/homoserine lactone efflux protein
MSLPLYAAFVAAAIVLMLIPGPNLALIVANTVSRGRPAGFATLAGTTAAMVPQLALTCLGMTALIAGAAEAFSALRWLGVAYLVYLAYRAFTAPDEDLGHVAPQRLPLRRLALRGFLVSLSNPKTLFFFAAFFPQFVDPRAAAAPQLALLCATFLGLALVLDSGWVLLAARVAGALRAGGRWRHRLTGGALLGAGLGLALARRP